MYRVCPGRLRLPVILGLRPFVNNHSKLRWPQKSLLAVVKCYTPPPMELYNHNLGAVGPFSWVAKCPAIMRLTFAIFSSGFPGKLMEPAERIPSCLWRVAERATCQRMLNSFRRVKKWSSDHDNLTSILGILFCMQKADVLLWSSEIRVSGLQ